MPKEDMDEIRNNTETMIKNVENLIIVKNNDENIINWLKGLNNPLDEKSKQKAYELYDNGLLNDIEVGTTKGLQQIHAYIFGGLYDFAGKIRTKTIMKDGFVLVLAKINYKMLVIN